MNNVQLIGRISTDLVLKEGQKGAKYCPFTIAVKRARATQNLEQDTDFIPCIAFGKTAEVLCGYKKKGNMVGVVGELNINEIKNENGKKYYTEVTVREIDFILNENKGS